MMQNPTQDYENRLNVITKMRRRSRLLLVCSMALMFQSCNDDTQFNRSASTGQVEPSSNTRTPTPTPNTSRTPTPSTTRTPETIKTACLNGNTRTVTKRLEFRQTRNGCDYGRNGNLSPRQGFVRAHRVETISVDLPKNAALCQLSIDSVSRDLRYDDFMFFNVNDIVLVGSSGELMRRLPQRQDIFRYDFDRIVNSRADFDDRRRDYCLGGSGECEIPGHDTPGPMEIDFVSDKVFDLSAQLGAAQRLDFSLVTTGDNDNDCFHTDFILDLEARYTVF